MDIKRNTETPEIGRSIRRMKAIDDSLEKIDAVLMSKSLYIAFRGQHEKYYCVGLRQR